MRWVFWNKYDFSTLNIALTKCLLMTLRTAFPKTIFSFLLFFALFAPSELWAQRFEIDASEFFNDNNGEVTQPKSFASAGPKAEMDPEVLTGPDKETDIVLKSEKVSVPEVKAVLSDENLTTSEVLEDPLPCSVYGVAWDTLHVRAKRTDFSSKNDTSFINLANIGGSAFIFPFKGQLLSPFGYRGRHFHAGVDIKLNHGDTVVSAFDGKVRMAKYYSGYGNAVVIRHSNGLETLYGHLSKLKVQVNQEVKAGDLIGLGGRTGRASCNHLHFETRYLGEAFNPRQFIDLESYTLSKDVLDITRRTFGRTKDYLPTAENAGFAEDKDSGSVATINTETNKHSKTKGRKYHSIKNGETLYAIALRNNTTVKDLCSLNGIKKNKTLKIGTRLRIK